MEVVASLSQGRTAAAQCGLFTHKSVPVIFEPPCKWKCCVVKFCALLLLGFLILNYFNCLYLSHVENFL